MSLTIESSNRQEAYVAEVTDTAYQAAIRKGFNGSFLELELELWYALKNVLDDPGIGSAAAK